MITHVQHADILPFRHGELAVIELIPLPGEGEGNLTLAPRAAGRDNEKRDFAERAVRREKAGKQAG